MILLNNKPSFLQLREEFLKYLGSMGMRLKNFDAHALYQQLQSFRTNHFPDMSDGDFGFANHLLWVQRNYELTGLRFDQDRPIAEANYDFDRDYGEIPVFMACEKPLESHPDFTERKKKRGDEHHQVDPNPSEDDDTLPLWSPDFENT